MRVNVKSWFEQLKRFLTAEEVPRWFGLSIVLIYLVGLGSVSRFGIQQARHESTAQLSQSSGYAVSALSNQLSKIGGGNLSDQEKTIAYRLSMRAFSTAMSPRVLRLIDHSGIVVASINSTEIGTSVPLDDMASLPANQLDVRVEDAPLEGGRERVYRKRLSGRPTVSPLHRPVDATTDSEQVESAAASVVTADSGHAVSVGTMYLEARLPTKMLPKTSSADQASLAVVVFIVLGALFLVYRCLREQLRGVSRIAERLHAHRDRLDDDLECLRISDAVDSSTTAWNKLIDLVAESTSAVERTEADAELSRVLARSGGGALAEALHAIPDGIMYVTEGQRVEYANSAAGRLFGLSVKEAKGVNLNETEATAVGTKILQNLIESLGQSGSYSALTEVIQREEESGEPSTYRVAIIPVRRSGNEGECVVHIRDVSQQVRADRAREELITQVTHELRTPLTNIRAYAETLSSGMFDDPEVITECYNVITKETRRLSRLIEDVLSVSQLEVGGIELEIDQVDLGSLLSDCVRDIRNLADEKSIDLQLTLPSKMEPISADRDKLAVVIVNLLGNAIKYTGNDGNVIVGCQFTAEGLLMTFKDNGIGIDPSEHAKVFEKFYRAGDESVQEQTGTGIGLYTAREIVRRHGGELDLISSKGEGSTFMVRLPHEMTRASTLALSNAE